MNLLKAIWNGIIRIILQILKGIYRVLRAIFNFMSNIGNITP